MQLVIIGRGQSEPQLEALAETSRITLLLLPLVEEARNQPCSILRALSTRQTIQCDHATIVRFLREPEALIRLNPSAVAVEGQPSPAPGARKLLVMGRLWFETTTKYAAAFTDVEGGVDSLVGDGVGTRLHNQWRAKRRDQSGSQCQPQCHGLLSSEVLS